jgi:hypothetical protein
MTAVAKVVQRSELTSAPPSNSGFCRSDGDNAVCSVPAPIALHARTRAQMACQE